MDRADSAAGSRLWAQAPRLRLLLRHLAGNALRERVELDDLVQETFLRVLASPGGLPPAQPGAAGSACAEGAAGADVAGTAGTADADLWRLLVHVARHVVVDVARAARAAKRGGMPLPRAEWSQVGRGVSQCAAITAGPATRAIGNETQTHLERAFATLSAEHRRVLGLRQLQGLSAEEAGARMGRSATAVHSLYRRALLAWEQALGEAATRGSSPRS